MRTIHLSVVLAGLFVSLHSAPVAGAAEDNAFERLLARHAGLDSAWPGFDPRNVPVAIYDGNETLLFNHPQPPGDFSARGEMHVYEGRHPAIMANSSAPVGDVLTATILLASSSTTTDALLGLMAHEMFHVYQRQHYPGWSGNEAVAFTYPVTDEAVMASRIIEETELASALEAGTATEARCHAAKAMHARKMRFAELVDEHRDYERRSELNEGLARYIQALYALTPPDEIMPTEPFAPDRLRRRFYETGAAMALLLDRFMPDWKTALTEAPDQSLDQLLTDVLDRNCNIPAEQFMEARTMAGEMVSSYLDRLVDMEDEYLAAEGIRLRIVAKKTPLMLKGFDPLNVSVLQEGKVLHSRMLMLQNAAGNIEMTGRAALTHGAGAHPLFNGVAEVLLTGLSRDVLEISENGVHLAGDELSFDFTTSRIEQVDDELVVFLD